MFALLFAIQPIVSLYAFNNEEMNLSEIVLPLFIVAIVTIVLLFLSKRFLRNSAKAGVLLSVFWFLFFAYGHVVTPLLDRQWSPILVSSLWICAMAGILGYLGTLQRSFATAARLATVAGFVALVIPLFTTVEVQFQTASVLKDVDSIESTEQKPHIFYIIMDEHTRADSLKKYFNYDSSSFIDHLKEKGFYVGERSTSNYPVTFLSLASSLNMEYLDPLLQENNMKWNMGSFGRLIRNNKVARTLRERGYKIADVSTMNMSSQTNPDYKLNTRAESDFTELLWSGTPVNLLLSLNEQNRNDLRRKDILNGFEMLKKLAQKPDPVFAFAHFELPHRPFIFGPNGEPVDDAPHYIALHSRRNDLRERYISDYRNAVEFGDKKVMETIDAILADHARPTVIILQGDHGSTLNLNFMPETPDDAFERMTILNAYYFPSQNYQQLTSDITPVNSMRAMFNAELGGEYPLLPTKNFYSQNRQTTAQEEVTADTQRVSKAIQQEVTSGMFDTQAK